MAARSISRGARTGTLQPRKPDPEERKRILRCQDGDPEAFRCIFEKYQRRTYAVAYNILNDGDLARDVVQEAFIRVFRNIRRFDPSKNFYTWLYQIVVNLSIDFLRKRTGRPAARLEDIGEPFRCGGGTVGPADTMSRAENQRRVREVLEALPAKYKVVLTLRDIEGFSCEEIAEIVNCKNSTVRWRIHQARKLFKGIWNGEGTAMDQLFDEDDTDEL